jgi:dTDP-4-dehydrorhamnose 3,5-epimerase
MPYIVTPTALPGVLLLEPKLFGDSRGHFFESYSAREFDRATGLERVFVQDNHVYSVANVIRGLHVQIARPQGKLMRVTAGEIWDVAVDVRRSSPSFGQHVGVRLTAESRQQLWVPEGFAHGYMALSATCEVSYKVTEYWTPGDERCIVWNDPTLAIPWPLSGAPVLSPKDAEGFTLANCELPA